MNETELVKIRFSDRYNVKDKLRKLKFDDPSSLDLTLKGFEILTELNKQDLSIINSLKSNKNVTIFDHQILAALKVKNEFGGTVLLADEVGLGKTIEAGIVLKEYLTTGLIKNALILTPPSLVNQWQDELLNKFNLDFVTQYDESRYIDSGSHDLLILSHASAIQPKNSELLKNRYWDMIIIDEAHSMKNSETLKYQLVKDLTKKFLLLLSATPIQNNLKELYNLVEILRPGLLGSWKEFRTKYAFDNNIRKLNPFNKNELQELLSHVLIRTTRNEVRKYIKFTDRIPSTHILQPSPLEQDLYSKATDIIKRLYSKDGNFLALMIFQRLISSSTASTIVALYKIKENYNLPEKEYQELLSIARKIQMDSKMNELLKFLQKDNNSKFLIFTEFYATQNYISKILQDNGYSVTNFNGKMSSKEKDASISDFRNQSQIMVSTGAGGEGQNFQFCHNIVNYDLPWNPMRVEQRVGRVHRIGQENNVFIYNIAVENTIDAYILELLYTKIHLFTMTLGEIDLLFEDVTDENIQSQWFKEYMTSKTNEEVKNKFSAMGENWKKNKEQQSKTINEFNSEVFENFNLSSLG